TLEGSEQTDPERRYVALVGLGRAGAALTERTHVQAFIEAARLAQLQGWAARQARAIIELAQFAAIGEREGEAIDRLIVEALAAVGPGDSPERAMLLARRALQGTALVRSRDEMEAEAAEALAMARRLGGNAELSMALQAKAFLLLGTPEMEQLEEVERERAVL